MGLRLPAAHEMGGKGYAACTGGATPRRNKDFGSGTRRREARAQALPFEPRAGIGLAAGRDVAVAGDVERAVTLGEGADERGQRAVLGLGVGDVVGALELDADGEVVAALAALPCRGARVPGALGARDVLNERAVAGDHEMRGHAQAFDGAE